MFAYVYVFIVFRIIMNFSVI